MGPVTKIYFRYLFGRLFVPFLVCLCGCALIWIMADLYGNIDDFLEHKINILVILRYYSLQIPNMLILVLPSALLVATLWTLLSLNRRCELVAFQSGGMAPIWLFTPFFAFGLIWVAILAVDLNWPAPKALVTRDRLLQQVKGQNAKSNVFVNLPYVDTLNRRVWFFQSLDTNQDKAKGVEILQRDADGHDMVKYFARNGEWTGAFWRLSGVLEIIFTPSGSVQEQKTYEELDLPDVTTPPKQLSLIASQPEYLTVNELSQYIATSTATKEHVASYRTEWWYRWLYPLSLIILMLFALIQGTRTDRRSPVPGIVWSLVVLIAYIVLMNGCMALGKHSRFFSPFMSVITMEMIFGAVGLYLLGLGNGWWWQLLEHGKRLKAQWEEDPAGSSDNPNR